MPERWWVLAGVMLVAAIAHYALRRRKARRVAFDWLRQHGYHARRLTIPLWSWRAHRFAPAPLRNNDKAFYARAEVEDRKLGGVGVVWLRTWIGWTGEEIWDTEVFWERMPAEGEGPPAGPVWEDAQLALLERIAAGEHTLRPADSRSTAAGAAFDLEVEHVLALQRRGLVTCATPVAETRVPGRAYAYVSDVTLTEEGARFVQRRQASTT
jgi:hypothetical protein